MQKWGAVEKYNIYNMLKFHRIQQPAVAGMYMVHMPALTTGKDL